VSAPMPRVLVLPGDGVGPEVIAGALRVLGGLDLELELVHAEVGRASFERHGVHITDEVVDMARRSDAVLMGAVDTPRRCEGYRSPVLTLRRQLDLYANVRPARPLLARLNPMRPPRRLDVVIVRENTEDVYCGGEREVEGGVVGERLVTRRASERVHTFAFAWARSHGRRKVTCVHKANVLRASDGLFLSVFREVAAGAADGLGHDDMHVDAAAERMVRDPGFLDVMVTTNMFGDILSDLAAGLVGGLGFAPSANLGDRHALFEPVHGSAPDIAGRGMANPTAAILSVAMMLEHMGRAREAAAVEGAVVRTLRSGVATRDAGGRHGTQGFARAVADRLDIDR
jgi:methanogen homoisocitrate dehydrogenase